jgi:zinc D-Ala-D-Ala carboxypeptidase
VALGKTGWLGWKLLKINMIFLKCPLLRGHFFLWSFLWYNRAVKSRLVEKIFTPNTYIALIIGLSLFGVFKYVEYRLNFISEQIGMVKIENETKEFELNKKVTRLEGIIEGSGSNLADILKQEQEKSNSLINQFNEITNTVGVLSKLSKTDPELLKKYSKVYFLNEHYEPVSLAEIEEAYKSNKEKKYEISTDVSPFLKNLIEAGNSEGKSLLVLSAYRSFGTQAVLKENYKITYSSGANKFSADQGYSEHQLGTTIDFTTKNTNGKLEGFDKTPEYEWLLENAHNFGFVLSYPAGNKYYKFEPWHWRFVGVALATKLFEDKINFYDMDQRLIDNYLANIFDQ